MIPINPLRKSRTQWSNARNNRKYTACSGPGSPTFGQRPDVLLDYDTYICYDRRNLNVRICPDVCLVFGVDNHAIRPRRLYLPWEAGKPPDWVLEMASPTTGRVDINRKPGVYAHIGVPEFWRFDPSGGRYHGELMAGEHSG